MYVYKNNQTNRQLFKESDKNKQNKANQYTLRSKSLLIALISTPTQIVYNNQTIKPKPKPK